MFILLQHFSSTRTCSGWVCFSSICPDWHPFTCSLPVHTGVQLCPEAWGGETSPGHGIQWVQLSRQVLTQSVQLWDWYGMWSFLCITDVWNWTSNPTLKTNCNVIYAQINIAISASLSNQVHLLSRDASLTGSPLAGSLLAGSPLTVVSVTDCAQYCMRTCRCLGFSITKDNTQCIFSNSTEQESNPETDAYIIT